MAGQSETPVLQARQPGVVPEGRTGPEHRETQFLLLFCFVLIFLFLRQDLSMCPGCPGASYVNQHPGKEIRLPLLPERWN